MTSQLRDRLLTVKEYAFLFRQHPKSVYRRIRRGTFTQFPIQRDGRTVFILVPATLAASIDK